MLTTDRRTQILEILRQNGSVTVSGLAEKFETSESTIRRDLLALSQLGKINKVHGGATALGQEFLNNEENFNEKSLQNINEKEEIAKYADNEIAHFYPEYLRTVNTQEYKVDLSDNLYNLKIKMLTKNSKNR